MSLLVYRLVHALVMCMRAKAGFDSQAESILAGLNFLKVSTAASVCRV